MAERTCTVILPTYNEEGNIVNMITAIKELHPDFHVLIMDDNSTDHSKELVDALDFQNVRFFVRDPNDRGLTASICQGIVESDTEFFINMDSDFQHPVSSIDQIYKNLCEGHDLCIGVRKDRLALGFKRWLGSWMVHILASLTLFFRRKKRTKDIMSGLFGGKTDMFRKVILEHGSEFEMKGFKALLDILKFAPPKIDIGEITYEFGKRLEGESKISSRVVISALRQCGPVGRFLARIYGAVKK